MVSVSNVTQKEGPVSCCELSVPCLHGQRRIVPRPDRNVQKALHDVATQFDINFKYSW